MRQYRGKRVDSGEWVKGFYTKSFTYNKHFIHFEKENNCNGISDGKVEVIPETIGIERGLPDKNGNMIYQGDIISINGFHKKIVGFDEHGFYLENVDDIKNRKWMDTRQRPNPAWWNDFERDIEIVGTVHDNPELLEESK